ncbi:hypothetical protein HGA13_31190 [Nocardia speluncae]|uniref:DUF3592 domain-containing protein n=1 Tax=Nocardia speluncae TaxID=419477 RepID=A0A846XQQ5_9NOCA|nr:hypothetical protein [Nocardia speluncae]NKY37499.1 hypothetical protein [Nocardia speluncae]
MPFWFWRIVGGIAGLALSAMAAVFLTDPINIAAYYLGYGKEMRVEVSAGTSFLGPGGDSPGPGAAEVIGEGRKVGIYDADSGETLTARPRLIDTGVEKYVYHGNASVLNGLTSIIPVFLFGIPGLLLLLLLVPNRLLRPLEPVLNRLTARLNSFNDRTSKSSADHEKPEEPNR